FQGPFLCSRGADAGAGQYATKCDAKAGLRVRRANAWSPGATYEAVVGRVGCRPSRRAGAVRKRIAARVRRTGGSSPPVLEPSADGDASCSGAASAHGVARRDLVAMLRRGEPLGPVGDLGVALE